MASPTTPVSAHNRAVFMTCLLREDLREMPAYGGYVLGNPTDACRKKTMAVVAAMRRFSQPSTRPQGKRNTGELQNGAMVRNSP
jgi:hypothetical protein